MRSRKWTRFILSSSMALALLGPAPASAHHNGCPDPAGDDTEMDLANWPPGCRNFIYDPGPGRLMSRSDLLSAAPVYTSPVGHFSQNFLWYSRETTIRINSDSVRWTACRSGVRPGTGNYCSPGDVSSDHFGGVPHNPGRGGVLDTFHDASFVDLSVFEYGGVWIAKVCGNWLETTARPKPVPTITVEKFRDDNGDGAQAGSEPGLSQWQFEITPVTAPHGGSTASQIVETDGGGRAVFRLDGYGPGRYQIREINRIGWEATTAATQFVDVPLGAMDANYAVSFGNRQVADVAKTAMTIAQAPAEMAVGEASELIVDVTVANLGPATPVDVEDTLRIELPADCTATSPVQSLPATLAVGIPQTLRFTYAVTCTNPSFHDFAFVDSLRTTTPGVHDPDPSNNARQTPIRIPVIATTDLKMVDPRLLCDRATAADPYFCDLSAGVASDGPFEPVDATLDLVFAASDECVVTGPSSIPLAGLTAGETRPVAAQWEIECDPAAPVRSFELGMLVNANDVHVRDSSPANNHAEVAHTDADIKPNSDPNSINLKRKGVTSVAILSSGTFDALSEVDAGTVRFGRTGTEAAALRCADEDANADGLVDVVCHFDVADTGFLEGDTVGILTARLADGSLLFASDAVRILHA